MGINTKHPQKTAGQNKVYFRRYSSTKFKFSPKIDQKNLWMIQPKIFRKKNFFSKVCKWSNSQKSAIKNFSIFFPLWGHPGPTLRKFFEKIEIFFFSKFQNGPIRKVNTLKPKCGDIFVPAPLWRSFWHLEKFSTEKKLKKHIFFKVSKWSNSQS